MFLNYSFPVPSAFAEVSTSSRAEIAVGVRIALDPDKGMITTTAQGHLVFDLDWSDPPPAWSELALVLAPEWRQCRQIFLRYRAAAEARGALVIQSALRLGQEEGFSDHFSPTRTMLGPEPEEHVAEFTLTPRLAAPATWMDLHLFFGQSPGRIALYELSLTGLR